VTLKPGEQVTVTTIARRPSKATIVPSVIREGEWHDLSVFAANDRVTVLLDGRSAATVEGREHQVGYIGLEVKRGTMEFRRIRISEAAPTACTREPTKEGASPETPRPRGVALPRVTREVRPNYTIEALNDRVEGYVWVEAVVLADGTVGEACVRRSLHADLDVEALAAARRWLFAPGRREDQPVPVLVTIELSFSLKR
jgi:TonB family protein